MRSYKFGVDIPSDAHPPDVFMVKRQLYPQPKFVISRDKKGNNLSLYEDNTWQLYPYSTVTYGSKVIRFYGRRFNEIPSQNIVDELKMLFFLLLWKSNRGRSGKLAITTVCGNYGRLLFAVARFSIRKNVSIREIVENTDQLAAFARTEDGEKLKQYLASFINIMIELGEEQTGFRAVGGSLAKNLSKLHQDLRRDRQYEVIPSRLFSEMILHWHSEVDQCISVWGRFARFVKKVKKHPGYAISIAHQSIKYGIKKKDVELDFQNAMKENGLSHWAESRQVKSIRHISAELTYMQAVCKSLIHVYTGMRSDEVRQLKLGCYSRKASKSGLVERRLIGVTTKYAGHKKNVYWITCQEVESAVSLAKNIAELISNYADIMGQMPLFISPSYLEIVSKKPENEDVIVISRLASKPSSDVLARMSTEVELQKNDIQELEKIDPSKKWRPPSSAGEARKV